MKIESPTPENATDAQEQWVAAGPAIELDADHFSDLITALTDPPKADAAHDSDQDERRRPRTQLQARGTIIPLRETSHPGALAILVRDLSPSGLGFLYEHQMGLGEQFALLLPREGDSPSVVLCAVASWQPLARDLYAIGARFVRVLRDSGVVPLPIRIDPYEEKVSFKISQPQRVAS